MNKIKREQWRIIPKSIPDVKRNCSKCGGKSRFQTSNKFRVNANGRLIDVWLIYRCSKCKTVWNMTIYERIDRASISPKEYQGFMNNHAELAKQYGTNAMILQQNKAALIMDDIEYDVLVDCLNQDCDVENKLEIQFVIPSFMEIRLDTLLAKQLQVSRSYIQKRCKEGFIYEKENCNISKSKVRSSMVICFLNDPPISY